MEVSDELKEGLVQRQRRAPFWSQHLRRYRSVFVKPVTPAQEAKTVVASGAAVLTFTHQRWRAVCRHSNVPSVLTTSQSSGGRVSASVHPAHKTLVDSSRRVRCMFVLRQPQLLVVSSLPPPSCFPFSSRFLDLRWQACPQPHSCCCVQLLQ